jgi:hypothetical protein
MKTSKPLLLSGDAAIAMAALDADVAPGARYLGTPSQSKTISALTE